jgi:N-acetyl-anhydromuramyl-L-alanine amidase AmpD
MNVGNWNAMREPRVGIMLHYTGGSFQGSVAWCRNPRSKVSYNWIIDVGGDEELLAPGTARAWHAGVCRPSDPRLQYTDANSAFYGIAIAATTGETATDAQVATVIRLCQRLFQQERWRPETEAWRVVGHDTEAWPRGRKVDPTGPDPRNAVLSVATIRDAL